MPRFRLHRQPAGVELILVLTVISIVAVLGVIALQLVVQERQTAQAKINRETAFQIAEAGVNYYRWHLAHDPDDYQDDTGQPGPYVHDAFDQDGNLIGQYSLVITPPQVGSTITTVQSTGSVLADPTVRRSITARMGIPSFSNYAVLANDVMRFGQGTVTFGPIHSNLGIRFDGVANGLVTSSCSTYDDPDHGGPNEGCVHTHEPNPATVFLGGSQYPVPPVDFTGVSADLAQMKLDAIANGLYRAPSGGLGYHLVLKTNDVIDIYRVNTLARCQYRVSGNWFDYNNIWSVNSQTLLQANVPMPANGIFFAEDDVWVDGQINTARITIVAAREPIASANATIVVNNNLRYTNYDGSDVIGLIAQTDISVGFYSADTLQIDAALIAQRGRVGRYYYAQRSGPFNPANCGNNVIRNTLTLNGSLATNLRYGFAYTDGTGYQNRILNFDDDLTFGPPPSFPTTGEYTVISWDEDSR